MVTTRTSDRNRMAETRLRGSGRSLRARPRTCAGWPVKLLQCQGWQVQAVGRRMRRAMRRQSGRFRMRRGVRSWPGPAAVEPTAIGL